MPKPLPRKVEFVCSRVEPRANQAGLIGIMLVVGTLSAGGGFALVNASDIEPTTKLSLSLLLSTSAVIFGFLAFRFFSDTSPRHATSAIKLEVGIDGLHLPLRAIPFASLQTVVLETSTSAYSILELVLNDGESVKLSMLNAEPVVRLIRERHELFKWLMVPQPRRSADGYRGVRVSNEVRSIEEAVREEDWADENVEVALANAFVIPREERYP
ncbi:MAG: hypothetical protein AB8H86_21275 [Polyangiales bacterium]